MKQPFIEAKVGRISAPVGLWRIEALILPDNCYHTVIYFNYVYAKYGPTKTYL